MSSALASTSSFNATSSKASKNPGLALDLTRAASQSSKSVQRLSPAHSLSKTPELEPDWNSDDDASDFGDDDDAQYVYIYADSPFYRGPSLRTSSYISFSGFPFACDALAEEDPLFADSPDALFDKELSSESGPDNSDDIYIVVVDADLAKDMDSQSSHQWNLMELQGSLDLSKQNRVPFEEVS
ncbi:hypothetical protein DXG03_008266 [Asterophora parasitica]|uniref:Uncharacterized protein n=1 Tax=Asterophora parasitica TaxID=117018 RepID=A0A9P7G7V4_9AGAR|nr:hypothetical protein DXG03_008266 [Asterophora parasitica]